MIEVRTVADLENTFDRTEPLVVSAENKPFDPRIDESSRAHYARLDCRINSRANKTIIADLGTRCSKRDDLGVRSWIVALYGFVASEREQIAAGRNDRAAHRNLAYVGSAASFEYRFLHPEFVVHLPAGVIISQTLTVFIRWLFTL